MVKYICDQCGKEFTQKSHHTSHINKKNPCNYKSAPQNVMSMTDEINIESADYYTLKQFYNTTLNKDKTLMKSSNDENTPIECVEEMISKIPSSFWKRDVKILDPCCGNGNFSFPIYHELIKYHPRKKILEDILVFNEINEDRLQKVKQIYCAQRFDLNIMNEDFLAWTTAEKFDLIVANPPYAKIAADGKRTAKNHNLIKLFITKSLELLTVGGYLLFITPDNWMSYADRNKLIKILTEKQIVYLNIHTAKKYFKKVGSSFTWYLIENTPSYKDIEIEGKWRKEHYHSFVQSEVRSFIPLFYKRIIQNILHKTTDDTSLKKFDIKTNCDLHKYTKKKLIQKEKDEVYKYKLIHTPNQTVYASRPHKYQDGWKVFISTTSYYGTFVDECGMTQSIAFIRCENKERAILISKVLMHPLYQFINNICRWGNFNNIRVLQSLPFCDKFEDVYSTFNITEEERTFIESHI